jgi:predicted transcriptional regulator
MSNTTYKKLSTVQKLVVVNQRLRHGDMSKVARKTEFSPTTVKNVIEGKTENGRVLNAAYDLTRGRKKNFQVIKDFSAKRNETLVNS